MFAHKEISHKVRRPTRSENARHLLVWVYRERCVHILYAFWAYYTQCLYPFCSAKASHRLPLHYTMCSLVKTSRMRQSQKVVHAWRGLDCDLRPNEKKAFLEFQLGRFLWNAPIIIRYLALRQYCAIRLTTSKWIVYLVYLGAEGHRKII